MQVVQKGKPEQGVKSEIRIVDPEGNTKGEFLTDGAGTALVTVPSCDQNAKIVADPILFIFQETTRSCTGDPTVIEVAALQQARAIGNLNKVKNHIEFLLSETNDPAFEKILNEWDALNDALAQNNYSRAAFHSANAAYLLRQKDRDLSENVGFAAMYFGYRALGVDPAAESQPMLQFDTDQNQYVMTGPGAVMLRRYQAQVGNPVDGVWDGDDFGNLRKWRVPVARAPQVSNRRNVSEDEPSNSVTIVEDPATVGRPVLSIPGTHSILAVTPNTPTDPKDDKDDVGKPPKDVEPLGPKTKSPVSFGVVTGAPSIK